ncbi:MAG: ECF-type sigma factor [Planctomycetota bacterium]
MFASAATDGSAAERLTPLLYEELRALAASYFTSRRRDHTLQPTAVVNEAYVRLVGNSQLEARDRAHFFNIAAKAMRHVLADHARRRRAEKRGGDAARVTLAGLDVEEPDRAFDASNVHEALDELAAIDERRARVVELRFFGGLTIEQIAESLGVTTRTIDKDWRFAKAWLRDRLNTGGAS